MSAKLDPQNPKMYVLVIYNESKYFNILQFQGLKSYLHVQSRWQYPSWIRKCQLSVFLIQQDRRNGFQSGGTIEHWKILSTTMVDRQENVLNFRRSRMAKIVTCWPWWQPSNNFYFKTLCFFSCFLFFFLLHKKMGVGGGGHSPPRLPSVSGQLLLRKITPPPPPPPVRVWVRVRVWRNFPRGQLSQNPQNQLN